MHSLTFADDFKAYNFLLSLKTNGNISFNYSKGASNLISYEFNDYKHLSNTCSYTQKYTHSKTTKCFMKSEHRYLKNTTRRGLYTRMHTHAYIRKRLNNVANIHTR